MHPALGGPWKDPGWRRYANRCRGLHWKGGVGHRATPDCDGDPRPKHWLPVPPPVPKAICELEGARSSAGVALLHGAGNILQGVRAPTAISTLCLSFSAVLVRCSSGPEHDTLASGSCQGSGLAQVGRYPVPITPSWQQPASHSLPPLQGMRTALGRTPGPQELCCPQPQGRLSGPLCPAGVVGGDGPRPGAAGLAPCAGGQAQEPRGRMWRPAALTILRQGGRPTPQP